MSMVHYVSVGFFGAHGEQDAAKALEASKCLELVRDYVAKAPLSLKIEIQSKPQGDARRGIVLGTAGGFPIVLKDGSLGCPYLASSYLGSSIGFAVFVCQTLGCSILDEDGRLLTIDEFVPAAPFSDLIRQMYGGSTE